jgi:hypothetical protein
MEWFIVVILTITSAAPSEEVLSKYRFKSEISCKEFVVKNYDRLNERVNKDNDQHHSAPNLYRCVTNIP